MTVAGGFKIPRESDNLDHKSYLKTPGDSGLVLYGAHLEKLRGRLDLLIKRTCVCISIQERKSQKVQLALSLVPPSIMECTTYFFVIALQLSNRYRTLTVRSQSCCFRGSSFLTNHEAARYSWLAF